MRKMMIKKLFVVVVVVFVVVDDAPVVATYAVPAVRLGSTRIG